MNRCKWCNLNNKKYIEYHDKEWGVLNTNDYYLFEILILESFQAGLSWECVLNKRENFKKAYDNFDYEKVALYDEAKINELANNKSIIRNKLKIRASINNAIIFKTILNDYGSFYNYLKAFTDNKIIYEVNKTKSSLSDVISKDLTKRGMKFVGTTIIYSFLQAIGIIYSHDKECFLYKEDNDEKNQENISK
ncbi:MAG TPA: DNA-3-methyladenine glycosylase I [Bacilli bacterium]|nr:DNA-3-methyladenine glycosylase I [Bacilli bacterium]